MLRTTPNGCVFLLLYLSLSCVPAGAQTSRGGARSAAPGNSSKLTEIRVLGSQRFQQSEVVHATGLKPGDDGSEDALKRAADRLAASGMFTDVTYRYVSGPEGTKAEFHVHDVDKLLPLRFDNFVWLPKEELLTRLRQREPLFTGQVPNAGEMFQKLTEDIKSVLADLHVSAEVTAFPQVPLGGSEVVAFLYKVEGVKLPIRDVRFEGASHEMEGVLQHSAAAALIGSDYSETKVGAVSALDFLPQYRMRGYLKAAFGSPAATLQDPAGGAVALQLPVQEGSVYGLAAIHWTGNAAFPSKELARVIRAQPGKPLNQVEFEEDVRAISKIYGTQGYMEARPKPDYVFDDPGQKVTVEVTVREGDRYRMGAVRFEGLGENSRAILTKLWALRPDDFYDSSYPQTFMTTASRQFDFSALKVQFNERLNRENKTVDVVWRFSAK